MVFGLGKGPFVSDPNAFASAQGLHRSPPTRAEAARSLKGYDYVIIGAGTAGSVLASRLTEDPSVSVLVLEAGGDHRGVLETKIPLTFSKLFHGKNDWNYYTVPQKNVANRELYWPRGKLIGGSSSMNAMMHHHCDAHDFNEWAEKYGCSGWSYADLQPYLRKSEKFTPNPNRPPIDASHRGNAGLWQTGYSWLTEIGEKGFLAACQQVGIPYNPDINTPTGTLGVTRFQTFIDSRGQRSSAATAYLTPDVLKRKNLTIAVGVHVTRVLFDVSDRNAEPIAIGVEFQKEQNGPKYEVHARREVIMAAGTVNTPQTLLLSGIGPRDELQRHSIAVVRESEQVGKNMKDHFCASGILCKAKPGYTLDYLTNDLKAIPSLARWLITGGGPLTSNVGEAAAFFQSTKPPFKLPASSKVQPKDYTSGGVGPDLELIGAPIAYVHHGDAGAPQNADAFSLAPIGLRPQSSGTITLQSRNPFDHPLIDPKYWSDPEDNDRKVLLVGLRVALEITRQKAFQQYLEPVEPNDDPDSEWWPYSATDIHAITDDQLIKFMSKIAFTLYHPVGSARMGPNASEAVVDLGCRVYGVEGLRIVDASVFPQQISGHPTATVIAMAEKMAEVIAKEQTSIHGNTSKTGFSTTAKIQQQKAQL